MSLFGTKKNYASIVAPLKGIEAALKAYMDEQTQKIADLEAQRAEINQQIGASELEIVKSTHTTTKISDLLASDLDEDGIADVDQLPQDDTPSDEL